MTAGEDPFRAGEDLAVVEPGPELFQFLPQAAATGAQACPAQQGAELLAQEDGETLSSLGRQRWIDEADNDAPDFLSFVLQRSGI